MKRLWNACKAFYQTLLGKQEEKKEELPPPKADRSHLRLLALLQSSGRLIDFLQEDISAYNDAQVGAAVRKVHAECRECLEEFVTIRPVIEQEEGSQVSVASGYNPHEIKVVGNVKGEPPYKGELLHGGWIVKKLSLPKGIQIDDSEILQPAEIEVR